MKKISLDEFESKYRLLKNKFRPDTHMDGYLFEYIKNDQGGLSEEESKFVMEALLDFRAICVVERYNKEDGVIYEEGELDPIMVYTTKFVSETKNEKRIGFLITDKEMTEEFEVEIL
jgi:hypothetical protein